MKPTAEQLANTLACAKDNALPEAVNGPNGLELCCAPFDEPAFDGLCVVLHDSFVTASRDGESETVDLTQEGGFLRAGEAILSILDATA